MIISHVHNKQRQLGTQRGPAPPHCLQFATAQAPHTLPMPKLNFGSNNPYTDLNVQYT